MNLHDILYNLSLVNAPRATLKHSIYVIYLRVGPPIPAKRTESKVLALAVMFLVWSDNIETLTEARCLWQLVSWLVEGLVLGLRTYASSSISLARDGCLCVLD